MATPGRFRETIAQAQFVEGLLNLITRDAKVDRDILLRGKAIPRPELEELDRLIFRDMFVQGRDIEIARSVDAFFQAVRGRWPEAWDAFGAGFVLNKTSGFRALMRLLRAVYKHRYGPNEVIRTDDVRQILDRSDFADDRFTTEIYKPGTSGEAQLFRDLRDSCDLPAN